MTSINYKYFFSLPPLKVWEYIANAELIQHWIMKNDFMPFVGVDFQFRTDPVSNLGFDGIFDCKVLTVIPFRKLSYSWKVKSGAGNTLNTIVLWTLLPKNGGTEVSLNHDGFLQTGNLKMFDALTDSWLKSFHLLDKLINVDANNITVNN